MKITVIGTRGIPKILGGVETHCEELFPRLVNLGYDVEIVRRSCYVTENNKINEYKGVKLKDIYAPKKKSIEAIIHTFLSIIYAKKRGTDLLHIHAIGPSLLTPFARLLGMKVVMTHHGPDYDRQKWGKLAKMILRLGEKMGVKYANKVIVISTVINDILKNNYNRQDGVLIYNGVNTPTKSQNIDYIEQLNLLPKKYVFTLGRFVEEKGFHGLIKAFQKANISDYKLVIAGDADHPDNYSEKLKTQAREAGVVLTGFIKGEKLNQLFTNAALFVLPSFHEGLPIALLEAMSYNLPVVVSDIPANLQVAIDRSRYFKCGDWDNLSQKLNEALTNPNQPIPHYDLTEYNWDHIAEQTAKLYESLF